MVSFAVSNGDSDYKISERSIGFRWFFTFLLLTRFKLESSKRKTIYVFDEPAANLHARAQVELLTFFEKMIENGDKIIYSTHSHHMVDPRWLAGAYIVENRAAKHDDADGYDLEFLPAKIAAIKYKQFLDSYPSRSHHFQPVIERLQYVVPQIVGTSPCVIVEGISDYYALMAASTSCDCALNFNIVPGVGSTSSGNLISLLMGRGEKFIVLLDDDKAGREARDRYRAKWLLPEDVVITLADIDASYATMALEALLGPKALSWPSGRWDYPVRRKKTNMACSWQSTITRRRQAWKYSHRKAWRTCMPCLDSWHRGSRNSSVKKWGIYVAFSRPRRRMIRASVWPVLSRRPLQWSVHPSGCH
ncbi:ATP-dependent nuclease [Pseudomonas sp. Teo4]|uniref:ATP-dependent nuclease n=1 Tax=Pseudomonas sp. Teo4 TaxID=3064528 RepID=UPI002ACB0597|nr:AAA family ATPase [Pseudomonas sp. Teo4]